MWTIGYDQVLDEPPSSPSILTLSGDRSRVPSISQPSTTKMQSNSEQMSIDSDAESDEGEGKSSAPPFRTYISTQDDQSFDDDGELNSNKDNLGIPAALNSPTGSDKFIVVTDVEILEAKSGTEPPMKSTYLDLKEGLIGKQTKLFHWILSFQRF